VIAYIGTLSPMRLLLSLLQYLPAGYCLARAYAKSGSLFAPMLIHATINLIAVLLM
jgi:membrane protease YdiL (CAAX protease family)